MTEITYTVGTYSGAVPARGQTEDVFVGAANTFLPYMSGLAPDINALVSELNTKIPIMASEAVAGAIGNPLPISNGGTGAATAALAREALGTHDAANITTGTIDAARVPQLTPTQAENSLSTVMGLVSGQVLSGAVNDGIFDSVSLAENGYIKLKNGLIIQWGYAADTGTVMTIPYNTPFLTRVFSINVQQIRSLQNNQGPTVGADFATSLDDFTLYWDSNIDGANWLALGV